MCLYIYIYIYIYIIYRERDRQRWRQTDKYTHYGTGKIKLNCYMLL